jgi:PAS domain S-box-containing protein
VVEKVPDTGGSPVGALARQIGTFVVVAAGYYLSARAGLALLPAGSHVAVVWPPAGIAVAAFLLLAPRQWGAAGAGVFCANLLANLAAAQGGAVSLLFAAVNLLEPLLIAVVLRRGCGGFDVAAPRCAALFLGSVAVVTSVTAAAGAAVPAWFYGAPFGETYLDWLIADSVGVCVLTPLLLLWRDGGRAFLWGLAPLRRAEFFGWLVAIAAASTLHLHTAGGTVVFAALGLTMLMRVAFAFGAPGVAAGIGVQAALMIGGLVNNDGPQGARALENASLDIQLFLIASMTAAYVCAAAFGEQRRLRQAEQGNALRLQQSLERLRQSEEKYRTVADYTYDWEYWRAPDGALLYMSPSCERITGYRAEEFLADPGLLARIAHPDDPEKLSGHVHDPDVARGGDERHQQDFRIVTRGGETRWIAHACVRVYGSDGQYLGRRASNRDITERKGAEELHLAQLRLSEYALSHSLEQLLTRALDEAETLSGSSIGFFHFLEADQQTLSLQAWSTNTLQRMCGAEGRGRHYPVDQAGVWGDCIRRRAPVVHNDYDALPHRRGLPPGHAPLTRELVVPIMRNDSIVAVFGIGNKPRHYDARDVAVASGMASLVWDIVAAKRAQEELLARTRTLDAVFESAPFLMLLVDADGRILNVSNAGEEVGGGRKEAFLGLLAGQALRCVNALAAPGCGGTAACQTCPLRVRLGHTLRTGEPTRDGEGRFSVLRDGELVVLDMLISTSPVSVGGGRAVLATVVDVTERKALEEQLRQAQKMEAIGTLAGGIAHDFNNVLNVIKGYGFLLERCSDPQSPLAGYVGEVLAATERGVDLTKSLLAFSRRHEEASAAVDLNAVVRGMQGMIARILGEDVRLEMSLAPANPRVRGDGGQLGQVLMNFATNARDAMPGSGRLEVVTDAIGSPEPLVLPEITLPPGGYAVLSVRDSGHGMSAEVRRRIFEPFYTTKGAGHGTGLGLSVVYGIVKQHRGHVTCVSVPGAGTVFTVYLPLLQGADQVAGAAARHDVVLPGGGEHLLIAEDDEAGRRMLSLILQERGYAVTTARDGAEALVLLTAAPGAYALLILDMVMPNGSGLDVLERARRLRPGIPAILMSGYSDEVIREKGLTLDAVPILRKPINVETLCTRVREALDEGAA